MTSFDTFSSDGIQLVSVTNHFKFEAPDGKQRAADATAIKSLLQGAMTDRIDDREIFIKGIDYSYYYEQEE